MIRRVIASLLLAGTMMVTWSRLYDESVGDRMLLIVGLAMLPAAAGLLPRWRVPARVAAGVAAVLGVAAVATGRSPVEFLVGEPGAWGALRETIGGGLVAAQTTVVPASFGEDRQFLGLMDLVLAVLVGIVAWQLLERRQALPAVWTTLIGLAYAWTVEPPTRPVLAGVLALLTLLAALALTSAPTGRGWGVRTISALAAAGLVTAVIAPSTTAGDATGWWNWRDWTLAGEAGPSSGLDIRQTYGQLNWPAVPREVMRVSSARRLSLRAAVLSDFDGQAFTERTLDRWTELPVVDGTIDVAAATGTPAVENPVTVTQQVTFLRLRSHLVLAAGRPAVISGPFDGQAEERFGGGVRVEPSLGPGSSYAVRTVLNDPSPADLVARTTYDEARVRAEDAMPELAASFGTRPVEIPLWGSGGTPPEDAALGDYALLRRTAREVVGDASSPYVAVNRIESYLRSNFRYDEAPPFPKNGDPPLVDFVRTTKAGFCQHFAGAMAVMLRSVGIPARLAVGYAAGSLDPTTRDQYVVFDRDAHTWVEAYLPEAGWVDFDPTPGRATGNRASVSSPNYERPPQTDESAAQVAPEPVAPPEPAAVPGRPEQPADSGAAEPTATGSGTSWWRWALPLAGVLVALGGALPWVLRGVRRRRARRTGDRRTRLLAAVGDLEDTLDRLGMRPPAHGDAAQRAEWLRRRSGVDAGALYAMAAAARYGPGALTDADVVMAWRDNRRLRRMARRAAGWRRRVRGHFGGRTEDRATVRRDGDVRGIRGLHVGK
ncbi:MAG: transglutaminaseTgpA domain-containing protein [Thermoleophilia bacterium]